MNDTVTQAGIMRKDLLEMAEIVAREKSIDKDVVLEAMEQAIGRAARTKYGFENDIRSVIDRKTGEIKLGRYREVVEEIPDPERAASYILLADAKEIDAGHKVGDILIDQLPPIDFGRMTAQAARQVIVNRVRDAERDRQFAEYKDRISEIVNGVVKRVEFGNVIVDLGRTEAILRREEMIPREHFGPGDRIRSYIYDVRRELKGPQVFLSRSHPMFMAKLFAQEVPEIYDGIIEIKAVARDPGSRAKIAVYTQDGGIDPVGACVGMRGSRVQAIVAELQGEKIDIILWNENLASFVVNALAPSEPIKVVVDEETRRLEVVVPDEQLSLAIGRRGQNVRLAATLTGCHIDVVTESEESERRAKKTEQTAAIFIEALDVDDVLARLLITEGFDGIEDLAVVETSEIAAIEGLDSEIAEELQNRAKDYIQKQNVALEENRKSLGVEDALLSLPHMNAKMLVTLGEGKIKTLDDLGDLASDELLELLGDEPELSPEQANEMIMAARAHWFKDDAATA